MLLAGAAALVFASPAEAKGDGCSGKKGAIVGAIVGAALGVGLVALAGKKSAGAAGLILAGAGVGALAGHAIDKRKCRLNALAKQYKLDLTVAEIAAADAAVADDAEATGPAAPAAENKQAAAGLYVSLRDDGRQFDSGSDQLTPAAADYFGKIAESYSEGRESADAAAADAAAKRVIVLVGHTDDVGGSDANAALSERRARAVAQIFRDKGIADTALFFQGAGETLPVADNRTDGGRARNRRVEIVDLPDTDALVAFLNRRLPSVENYRPVEVAHAAASNAPEIAPAQTRPAAKKPAPPAERAKTALASNELDFGGRAAASLAEPDIGPLQRSRGLSSFFASPARAATLGGSGIGSCATDRPRRAYAVKSLRSGEPLPFATSDYMRGLYDTSWAAPAGSHLVSLTHVTVLRDGGKPAAPPTLMLFPNYVKAPSKAAKPEVTMQPEVNVYRGERGTLYRVFAGGARNLTCIDMMLPANGGFAAPGSRLAYVVGGQPQQADWSPRIAGR